MSLYSDYINENFSPDDADEPTLECTNIDCEDEDGWPQQIEDEPAGYHKVRDEIVGWEVVCGYGVPSEWSYVDEPFWVCPKCKRQYGVEDWR